MQKRSNKNRRGVLIYDGLEKRLALNADMGGAWAQAQVLTQVSDDQFDDQGRLAYSKISYFSDANVLADPYRIDNQSWHYRDDGLVDTITTNSDLNADGSIDSRQLQTYQYNENSELLGILHESDNDLDGAYDDSYQESLGGSDGDQFRQETNEVLDDRGRVTRSTTTYYQGDNVDPYSIETLTWSYLEDGRVSTLSKASDSNADGVVDSLQVETYQFNENSELVGILYEYDNDGDGIYEDSHQETIFVPDPNMLVDPIRLETNEVYDDQGRLIGSTTSYYLGDSVDPYSIETQTWSYLEDGQLDTQATASDSNADGVVDSRQLQTYQYNENSELVGILYEYDNDGDGVYESSFDSGLDWGNGGICGTGCDGYFMPLGANLTPETAPDFPMASPISSTIGPVGVTIESRLVDQFAAIVNPEASNVFASVVPVADIDKFNLSAFVIAGPTLGVTSATSDETDSNRDPLSLPIVRSLSLASAVVLADENSQSGLTFESSQEKSFAVESATEKLGSFNDDFFGSFDSLSTWG